MKGSQRQRWTFSRKEGGRVELKSTLADGTHEAFSDTPLGSATFHELF